MSFQTSSKSFWSFAVLHSIFVINRIPTPILENVSPYELLHNKGPNFSFLKVFGCLAYASSLSRNRTKLDPKAHKCIFLGYRHGVKGFLLFNIKTRETFISKHVIFHEHIFPYHSIPPSTISKSTSLPMPLHHKLHYDIDSTIPNHQFTPHNPQPLPQNAQNHIPIVTHRSTRERRTPSYLRIVIAILPLLQLLNLL